ncbi:MAG TPA: hypothetical protein VGR85_05840 [Candidatus Limnocylindria bacterium]|nr:hypothetical protein [Candidatus Limnocylindria bacterium]
MPTEAELASLAALQEQVRAAITPVDQVLQSLLEQVAPTELLKDLIENVRALTGGLSQEFEGFRRMLREYEALEERAAPVLQVAGWPIVPSWPMAFVVELFTAAIDEGGAGVERRLLERYPRYAIHTLAHEISALALEEVRPRRALLAQALVAHRRRLTALTVPILLAQIDGLVRAFCDALLSRARPRRPGRKLRAVGVAHQLRQLPEHDRLYDAFVECLARLYTGGSLDRSDVLHGRNLAYGQERESLRLFCLFIALCEHLHDVRQAMAKRRVA